MTQERSVTLPTERSAGSLTRPELDTLLSRLAPEREAAGLAYERIRYRLVRFLEWRGCSEAELLADEAINRVARRLAAGLEIESEDPYVFFRGVAGRVFQEWQRQRMREREAHRGAARENQRLRPHDGVEDDLGDPDGSAWVHEQLPQLRDCLARLSAAERDLVLRFYRGDGAERIRERRRLAHQHEITMSALRLKAFRIRRRLERCMEERFAADD